MNKEKIWKALVSITKEIEAMGDDERIEVLNQVRRELHKVSPMKGEPVDLVVWVKSESVTANDYNPNAVAPPEMELLRESISQDGYTSIPEEAPPELEAKCWAPSWRRMCRVLLRNDHWCKGLGQTQPKSEAYGRYLEIKKARGIASKHDKLVAV
jgi:hypothetical protein